jgi:hypothetical protein
MPSLRSGTGGKRLITYIINILQFLISFKGVLPVEKVRDMHRNSPLASAYLEYTLVSVSIRSVTSLRLHINASAEI